MAAVTHAQIKAAVDLIVADQQKAIDAAVSEQKRIDDEALAEQIRLDNLVIEGQQAALEAQAQTIEDQKRTMDLQATVIADLTQQLADCQAGHEEPAKVLWGFNVGGYSQQGEEPTEAWARITENFGRINVVRWWVNWFFDWADLPKHWGDTPVAPNLGSDVAGVLAGKYDDRMRFICEQATRRTFLTFAHEPEDNGFTIADWQAAQMRLASIKTAVGNPLVSFGPLLMGASFHATRYRNTTGDGKGRPASEWLDFDLTDCDYLGADLYQWGTSDASADHAETVIGPVRDMAIAKGKHVLVGELGARRRQTVSDAIRARWITETADIVAANPGLFEAIMLYETDRGAADKVPWNLLPPPGGDPTTPDNSPLAVAAYRALCMA